MIDLDKPYFVVEGDKAALPELQVGDLNRNRQDEYAALFDQDAEKSYAPVLCLTVFTANDEGFGDVLVAVRDPDSNVIHPNVVSTPTVRIDPEYFVRLAADKDRELSSQTPSQHIFQIDGHNWMLPRMTLDCVDPGLLQNLIDRTLAVKLGLENHDSDFKNDYSYIAAVHSVTLGDSRAGVTEDWRDITEKVAMLNVLVKLSKKHIPDLPSKTKHYSDIKLVKPDDYRDMQDTKNLLPIFIDNAMLCIHGVCIATSRTALDDAQELVNRTSS